MGLIQRPAKIIEHIITEEVGASVDVPYYSDDSINLAFTVHDKQINSKKLIEGIASNSKIIPYFKDNQLRIQKLKTYINPELEASGGDVKIYIDQSDIISYTNKRTSPEKVFTKVVVNYHYDYALKEFSKNTEDDSVNPDTAYEHFQIEENWHGTEADDNQYYYNTYHGISPTDDPTSLSYKEQDYTFDAHYIRDKASAEQLQQFLLLWHCNQHNILKLKLPLKYIQLSIGDYVGFDKLINGVKLFGEDYSISGWSDVTVGNIIRNGQQILPVWMVTSTNKTLTHIDVELIQMHNSVGTLIDNTSYPPELSYPQMELTHPIPQLQETHVINTNIAIEDDDGDLNEYFTLKLSATVNDANEDDSTVTFHCSWYELLMAFEDEEKVYFFLMDLKTDNGWTWEDGDIYATKTFYGVSSGETIETEIIIGLNEESSGQDTEGIWLTEWLDPPPDGAESGDYIEFRRGTFSAIAVDETGETTGESIQFPRLRIYKDNIPEETVNYTYTSGWNFVSVPFVHEAENYTHLFPTAVHGTLYSFDGTYTSENNLIPGVGYWLNFLEDGEQIISGQPISQLGVELNEGWNLIGSISEPVLTDSIYDPDNVIIDGTFYGYDISYFPVDELVPGNGYWVNAKRSGVVYLYA